jgi:hypothetical protein
MTTNLSRRTAIAALASTAAASATLTTATAVAAPEQVSAEPSFDPSAARARAEHMVEQLRGVGIDEERAARFLRHFQPGASDDNFVEDVLNFACDYDQSLNWIYRGDATGMINALAARSPAAMRAASVDPIFGAIEVHTRHGGCRG